MYLDSTGVATKKVTTFAIGYLYKWDEFIGTENGTKVLEVLNEKFSDDGGHWEIQSEDDYEQIENLDSLEDLGLTAELRNELLEQKLTCQQFLDNMDSIMSMEFEVVHERVFKKHKGDD